MTIEVLEAEDPGGFGSFTASGPAVDGGIVCAVGEAMIVAVFDADTEDPPPWPTDPENLLVDWQFACADGSGQFAFRLNQPAHTDADTAAFIESGGTGTIWNEGSTWHTLSGTKTYADLIGEGTLTFEVLDPSGRPSRASWTGAISSGADELRALPEPEGMDITWVGAWHSSTDETEWTATGAAVDEGLVCSQAASTAHRVEHPDGSDLTYEELARLNDGTEPFEYVGITNFDCADGSGGFAIRLLNEVTNPAAFETTTTWEFLGGEGLQDLSGEGTNDDIVLEGQPVVITSTNTGVIRKG